jgi:hypothetical protein
VAVVARLGGDRAAAPAWLRHGDGGDEAADEGMERASEACALCRWGTRMQAFAPLN